MAGHLNKTSKLTFDSNSFLINNSSQDLFGGYLAGLIEGDGSIIVPKMSRNQKGKLLYPKVKITFVEKDLPLALKIKEVINGGTLEYPKNSNYVNLLFQDVVQYKRLLYC